MKKKLPWGELVFLGAILAFVVYYFFSVKGYGTRAVLWPYVLLVCTVLCVIAVAIEVILKAPKEEIEESEKTKKSFKDIWNDLSSYVVIVVSFIIYIALLKKLGMNICNLCLSFFLTFHFSHGKWKTAIIFSVCLTLAFYLIFGVALGIRLPKFKLF